MVVQDNQVAVELLCTVALRPDLIYRADTLLLPHDRGLWETDSLFSCVCKLQLAGVDIVHCKHIISISMMLLKDTRCIGMQTHAF